MVRELGRITLAEALELTALIAHKDPSRHSRYAVRCLNWTPGGEKEMVDELLELGAKHGLRGWLLWPTDDEFTHLSGR